MKHIPVFLLVASVVGVVGVLAEGAPYGDKKTDMASLVSETVIKKPGKLYHDRILPGDLQEGHR